ncbi:HNH endonuclease, partial [Gordonia paraffinivorans]|uniref:HNH endonuclease n=1 Tax=Gordonia paraffinivorans TaxID=175628 RepID=UPI0014461AC3
PHPEAFVVDHKTPFAHGGADTIDNKQPAHNRCNRVKSDRLEQPELRRHYTNRTW